MQLSNKQSFAGNRSWNILTGIPAEITVMIAVHKWVDQVEQDYLDAVAAWTKRAEGTNVKIVHAHNLKNNKYTFHNWAQGVAQDWDAGLCPFIKDNLGVVLWNRRHRQLLLR